MKGYHVSVSQKQSGGKKVYKQEALKAADRFKQTDHLTPNASSASSVLLKKPPADNFESNRKHIVSGQMTYSINEWNNPAFVEESSGNHTLPVTKIFNHKSKQAPAGKNTKTESVFLLFCGAFISLVSLFFRKVINKLKPAGYFAFENRRAVRPMIFFMNVLLAMGGFYLGINLWHEGLVTTHASTVALASLSSALILLYPSRKARRGLFKNTYQKQKWFSLLMTLSGLLLLINIGNRYGSERYLDKEYAAITSYTPGVVYETMKTLATDHPIEKYNEDDAGRIVASVFVIIFCVLLCAGIVILSCALACSGQPALSVLTLVVGLPVVILLTVHFVKKLLAPVRAKKKQRLQPAN